MTDEIELIHSPLTQTHSADGHTLHIQIYRSPGSPWVLEIEDETGTSTVWSDAFDTDSAALEAALVAIEAEGVHNFVTSAQQAAQEAESEWLHKLAQGNQQPPPSSDIDMMAPLSDEELDALELLLLELDAVEGMTMDMLDGYLHAIAIGPETLTPNQWLPKIWGQDSTMIPPMDSLDQLNQILGFVMRHFNSIVFGFEQHPPMLAPLWGTFKYDSGLEFEDAELWANGFAKGAQLNKLAWQALFDDPEGQRWYRPIGLLGADDFSADQNELTKTPEQRQTLTEEIEVSLRRIHAFWLPLRQAVTERHQAQRMSNKVGRNEPCPCGSGKKFKKCCGAPSELH